MLKVVCARKVLLLGGKWTQRGEEKSKGASERVGGMVGDRYGDG